ncbi:protease inhibitor I42 family protein [Nocardia sp. NPDC052566]|uniref:protease inhibitor I42 family protein n=1 Tax=Nocardia sp. NPDC052566 TaxID=3364330 RepID=UPI0037C8CE92
MRRSLVVLLLGLTLAACGKDDGGSGAAASNASPSNAGQTSVTVTDADNGQERQLLAGQKLMVTLPSNPSTGYSWTVLDLDPTVLKQEGDPEFRADPKVPVAPGSGGFSTWTFVGNAAGITRLNLDYARPWEQGMEPAQKFSLTIKVE